jgi:hypothetical protein
MVVGQVGLPTPGTQGRGQHAGVRQLRGDTGTRVRIARTRPTRGLVVLAPVPSKAERRPGANDCPRPADAEQAPVHLAVAVVHVNQEVVGVVDRLESPRSAASSMVIAAVMIVRPTRASWRLWARSCMGTTVVIALRPTVAAWSCRASRISRPPARARRRTSGRRRPSARRGIAGAGVRRQRRHAQADMELLRDEALVVTILGRGTYVR